MPSFPLESFSDALISFCSSSYSSALSEKVQYTKELQAKQIQNKVWTQTENIVPSEISLSDGSSVRFKYQYFVIKFNQTPHDNLNFIKKDLENYFPSVVMSLNFEENYDLYNLIYILKSNEHLLETKENKLQLLELLLKIYASPPCTLTPLTTSTIQDFILYIGKSFYENKTIEGINEVFDLLSFEDAKKEEIISTDYFTVKLLNLFNTYKSFNFCSCLIQPTVQEVFDENILQYLFSSNFNEKDIILVLNQIPFERFKESITEEKIEKIIFTSFTIALENYNYNQHLSLLLQLTKLNGILIEQYPSLGYKGLEIFFKSKWPNRLILTPSLILYPWNLMNNSNIKSCIYNIFHITNLNLNENEKLKHLNNYICTYLIPFRQIIEFVYKFDSNLKLISNNSNYPVIKVFSSMILKCSNESTNQNEIQFFIDVLFSFAYKSGSPNTNDLVHISNIRRETIIELSKICDSNFQNLEIYLNVFLKNINFLMKTQPKIIDSILNLISSLQNISTMKLTSNTLNFIITLMKEPLNLINSEDKYIQDVKDTIIKTLIQKIDWNIQNVDEMKFIFFENLISYSKRKNLNWFKNLIINSKSYSITSIPLSNDFSNFLKKYQKYDDEESISIWILCSCNYFKQYYENIQYTGKQEEKEDLNNNLISNYEKSLNIFKKNEIKFKLIEKIQVLSNLKSIFVIPILFRYFDLISIFRLNDILKEYILPLQLVVKQMLNEFGINKFISFIEEIGYNSSLCFILTKLIQNHDLSLKLFEEIIFIQFKNQKSIKDIISDTYLNIKIDKISIFDKLNQNLIWIPYLMILSNKLKIPNEMNKFIDNNEISQLYLSMEVSLFLISKDRISDSLIFLELFFKLYFLYCSKTNSNIPIEIKQKFNILFFQTSKLFESKSKKLNQLFNSFTTWNEKEIQTNFIILDFDFYLNFIKQKVISNELLNESNHSFLNNQSFFQPKFGAISNSFCNNGVSQSFLNMTPSFMMTPNNVSIHSNTSFKLSSIISFKDCLGIRMNVPNEVFISNQAKYQFLKNMYLDPFFKLNGKYELYQQIFSCIQNYSIMITNIVKENLNILDILKGLYVNKPDYQIVNVQTPFGIVESKVSNTKPVYSNPNNKQMLNDSEMKIQNYKQTLKAQSTTLSVLIFSLDVIISNLGISKLSNDQKLILKEILLNILTLLLDVNIGIYMNLIWKKLSNSILKISTILELDTSLQFKIFEKILKLKRIPEYIPVPILNGIINKFGISMNIIGSNDPLLVESSTYLIAKRQSDVKWNIDRSILFSILNFAQLNTFDFFKIFLNFCESDLSNFSNNEIKVLNSIFDSKLDIILENEINLKFNVESKFNKEREEIKLLFSCLQSSLSNSKISNTFGISFLKKCSKIGFPYEIKSFLKLILDISKESKIKTFLWQDSILLDKISLERVKSEISLDWLNLIIEYLPHLNDISLMCCLKFGHAVIQHTSLNNLILNSKIDSEPMNIILNFYTNSIRIESKNMDIVQPTTFNYILQSLNILFKNIPNLIERLWELYLNRLFPYAFKIEKNCRLNLSNFMKNQNWSISKFHILNDKFLNELINLFKDDPMTVCFIFSNLNWNFLSNQIELKSNYICKLFKLTLKIFIISEESIPKIIQNLFNFTSSTNEYQLLKKINVDDFYQEFDGNCFIDILTSYHLEKDPSDSFYKLSMILTKIGIELKNEYIAIQFLKEIKSILFLTIRSENNIKSCWCLTTKQHVSLIYHSIIPILKVYFNSIEIYKILFSCLSNHENNSTILISNVNNLKFSNTNESPFDILSLELKREYDNIPTIREDFIEKVNNSIFHFCLHSNENISIQILNIISNTSLSSIHFIQVLELTLISFLSNTKNEYPKQFAIQSLNLYDDVNSTFFISLLDNCLILKSALSLTILLSKLMIDIPEIQSILIGLDYIIKFNPNNQRDFDCLYLYLFALEIIENDLCDLKNQQILDKIEKFEYNLSFLGSIYSNDFLNITKKLNKLKIDQQMRNSKIQPSTSLGCRSIDLVLSHILFIKKNQKKNNDNSDGSKLIQTMSKDLKLNSILKLKKQKEFLNFDDFFNDIQLLSPQFIDHELLHRIISNLFELVPYFLNE
eukprot:gene5104-8702_t